MPTVTIQDSRATSAAPGSELRVFLSYAHQDARLASTFVQYFGLLAQELRLDVRDVLFYDVDRLLPGYVWHDHLQDSLADADLLIFLVSENSLRGDHYCMKVEVTAAARAGIPIVPVLLNQAPWEGQTIPGHPEERRLGELEALPRTPKRQVKPVTHWERRDAAWHAVIEGLRPLLKDAVPRGARPSRARAASSGPGAVRADLLPYLCDQLSVVRGFDDGLLAWDTRALVVLVKGVSDDDTIGFWERLKLENLSRFLARDSVRGSNLGTESPLVLPVMKSGVGFEGDLRAAMLYQISEALTGDGLLIRDVPGLIAEMHAINDAILLFAMPSVNSEAALRASLEGLLGLLDEIDREDVLRRTVIAVNLEDPEMVDRRLVTEWNLQRFRRSLLVELEPLCAVSKQDARVWYVQRRIRERFDIDEERITTLFAENETLRLRHFGSRVKPLFGGR